MAASNSDYLRGLGLKVDGSATMAPIVLKGYNGSETVQARTNGTSASSGGAPSSAPPVDGPFCHPCDKPLLGFAKELVHREGHPAWMQPNAGRDVGLRTFNSLTGERESFLPLEGNSVRWYTCGPTVYDVAHMGHARAYLTFDILRRIMVHHFKYDVKYQINITDIDDKIILRSRQNQLLKEFEQEAESMDFASLKKVVDEAVKIAKDKLAAKRPEDPAATASEKEKEEFKKLLAEHTLKMNQHLELEASVSKAEDKAGLLSVAKDPLRAKLDKERGHTVTGHEAFNAHSRHFENEYFEDMEALGVWRPDVVTRISDYMDGRVQKFIEKLESDGYAYASAGSVYFDIDSFNKKGFSYRKLVPAVCCSAAEMEEGEGALAATDGDKKNPNDFALWKKSKAGEPAWESKWGPGRPGWHIECSVMATDINGEFLDIHAGGEDLKFPHHDNEIAQTEAYLGRPQWTNYFWHAGHLHIQGLKMSKSLKNFITIRQALQTHTARQLRLMFLMQQWDKGMNYSDAAIDMAKAEEKKLKRFIGSLKFFLQRGEASSAASGKREADLLAELEKCKKETDAALKENFNTSKAVDLVSKLLSECDKSFEAYPEAPLEPLCKVRDFVVDFMGMLGVTGLEGGSADTKAKEAEWTAALNAFAGLREDMRKLLKAGPDAAKTAELTSKCKDAIASASAAGLTECATLFQKFVDDLLADSDKAKQLKRCDAVRDDDFVKLGIRLEDGHKYTGFIWTFDDTQTLEREARDAKEKQEEARKSKLKNTLTQKQQALRTVEKNAVDPAKFFTDGANAGLYSAFDDNGIPTKLKSGEDIGKGKQKDLAKALNKHKQDHEKLQKQVGGEGLEAYVGKLRKEVTDLEKEIGC